MKHYLSFLLLGLLLVACGAAPLEEEAPGSSVAVRVEAVELARGGVCSGSFVVHELDHVTTVSGGDEVRMFEANGGGVGINDLDNDGDLDIVLANHAASNSILWNEGALSFRVERMALGESRAVTIVDVDGDGWLDLVFTRKASAPSYWYNEGGEEFVQAFLSGVSQPLYALNWGDLDRDGDLDMVGATYDAGLLSDLGKEFLDSGQAGVYYYENKGQTYRVTQLANSAQALAFALFDLNGDQWLDLVVGNDFALPDYAWYHSAEGWREGDAFATTSRNTMSFDVGDINNDGHLDLFATDMKPDSNQIDRLAAWLPLMEDGYRTPREAEEPQRAENMLQVADGRGGYDNKAYTRGLDATGWSWSGKFGDLDQDGYLDLYVVNGMIEMTTFAHLPNHELIEENQALRNTGNGWFERMPAWALGSTKSGRGMSMGDLDGDGDLDIVVNNLRSSAQLFENQLCQGNSLQVDLWWPQSLNSRALGATLALHTSQGTFYRNVRAASGYLSGDPARIHFGLPNETLLEWLEIHWPDGELSSVERLAGGTLLTIKRE